jgi:uncharacterized protein with beta-barrel porin domain
VTAGGQINGGIINESGGTITAEGSAFELHHGGFIFAEDHVGVISLDGGIVNRGTITAGVDAFELYTDGEIFGSITNSGTITAGRAAIAVRKDDGLFNTIRGGIVNSGTITGGTNAINIVNASAPIAITNSGLIDGAVILDTSTLALEGLTGRVTGAVSGGAGSAVTVSGTFATENTFSVDNFSVDTGGRFSIGHGVTTTSGLSNAGTLAVAGGMDTTLGGNYTQMTGGNLEFSTGSGFGTLAVTGTVNLTASGLVTVNEPTLLTVGTVQDVLIATTLTAGTLTTTSSGNLFYSVTAVRDGNTIDLAATRDLLLTDAVSARGLPYASGVAGALEPLIDVGEGTGLDTALSALAGLANADAVADAAAQMVPILTGQATLATKQSIMAFSTVIDGRLQGSQQSTLSLFNQPALASTTGGAVVFHPLMMAALPLEPAEPPQHDTGHLWLKPLGSYADSSRRNGVPGYEADTFGIALGGDMQINDRLMLGVGLAWSDTEIEGKTLNRNDLDVEGYKAVLYGNYALSATDFIEGYALVGRNDSETRRDMTIGALNSVARGDYESVFTQRYTGMGSRYRISDAFAFTSVLSARYTYTDDEGYNERGAGVLNLTVNSNTEDSLIVGLDGTGTYTFGREGHYALSLAGGVGYDVMTDSPLVTSTLAGGGGAFGTRGAEPAEFVYRAGVGLTATPTERVAVAFQYAFDGRGDRQSHGGSINFRWQF